MVYVLESFYEVRHDRLAAVAGTILAFDAITVLDRDLLLRAVEVYEIDRLDFADAYLVASAEVTGVGAVASFDQALDRILTIRRLEPHPV